MPEALIWTLSTGASIIVGAALLWVLRPESKTVVVRHAFAVLGIVFLAIGGGLFAYRWLEHGWPSATPPAPGNAPQVSAHEGIELLALVLTLLTGIAVQYITSALATIKQQRDEVDKEVELYKNYSALRAELELEVDSWHRLRHYLYFTEAYIETLVQGLEPAEHSVDISRVSLMRRLFQPYELPLDALSPITDSLNDIGQTLKILSSRDGYPYRVLLKREHLDYIDAFARRIRASKELNSRDRQELLSLVRDLHTKLDGDRKRGRAPPTPPEANDTNEAGASGA